MIPAAQWRAALALASAHGHGWSAWAKGVDAHWHAWDAWWQARPEQPRAANGRPVSDDRSSVAWLEWDASEMFAAADWREDHPMVPIPIPSSWEEAEARFASEGLPGAMGLGIGPGPAHETGTGRLRWSVSVDGSVEITVWRPGLTIVSEPGAEVREPSICVLRSTIRPDGRELREVLRDYAERHVDALDHAVTAVQSSRVR